MSFILIAKKKKLSVKDWVSFNFIKYIYYDKSVRQQNNKKMRRSKIFVLCVCCRFLLLLLRIIFFATYLLLIYIEKIWKANCNFFSYFSNNLLYYRHHFGLWEWVCLCVCAYYASKTSVCVFFWKYFRWRITKTRLI